MLQRCTYSYYKDMIKFLDALGPGTFEADEKVFDNTLPTFIGGISELVDALIQLADLLV